MIKFDQHIVAIWYVQTLETQDWMASLSEIVPDEKYALTYRFRYYVDDKAFDSEDRKSWYDGTCSGTRNYCLSSLRAVAKSLAEAAGGAKVYEVLNDKGYEDFVRKFQDQPFVFARLESKDERERRLAGMPVSGDGSGPMQESVRPRPDSMPVSQPDNQSPATAETPATRASDANVQDTENIQGVKHGTTQS